MADKFCILPWKHLTIGTEGSYKLCCVAHRVMSDGGAPMSVYHHSLEHAWNSQYMRDVRRAMLTGEPVADCQGCYNNEASSGTSYRTSVAASMMDRSIEQVRAETVANDYQVDTKPSFLKLELGNLCNLECRMCGSLTSSQIERDPVHNRWAPTWGFDSVPVVTWSDDAAVIGPQPLVGVHRAGFASAIETDDGGRFYWSGDKCGVELGLDENTALDRLEIKFNAIGHREQTFSVSVNGVVRLEQTATRENMLVRVDLTGEKIDRILRIEIQSPGSNTGSDHAGVAIESIRLFRQASRAAELPKRMLFSRLPGRTLWENEDAFIFGEALGDPAKLDRLYITGGEPFLMKRVTEIIDYLLDSRNNHITLEFSTNCTKINSEILKKLSMFKAVNLALSLDGVNDTYEYIRFPAKWMTVDRNIRMLKQLPNAYLCVTPVVQIYNALNLSDLCRYCDEMGLDFALNNMLHWPEQLRVSLMPASVRHLAAERLRQYADKDCLARNRDQVLSVAEYFESLYDPPPPQLFHQFMLFTNDLDVTRGQKFVEVHEELYQSFREAGFFWTDETRYANSTLARASEPV